MDAFDVAVVGLGATGAAAARELARRGGRVLGLDRARPPHDLGSSHGQSRIIREAYFEHPLYVPLVRRAYRGWAALEQESGRRLLRQTGGVMIGPGDWTLIPGALASARDHGLAHEEIEAPEARRRFPALRVPDGSVAVWEPRAGILDPEASVAALLEGARGSGAVLRLAEPVRSWRADANGVAVETSAARYRAERLLLAAGPWLRELVRDPHLPLTVERQVVFWFQPRRSPDLFSPERLPVFLWEFAPGRLFYGLPDLGRGVKVACHHQGEDVDPETVSRQVEAEEVETIRTLLRRHVPDADGPLEATSVCLYTNTRDGHFLLDHHPRFPRVVLASPCSGHGFKFAPVLGEILADLVLDKRPEFDLSPFRLGRF